MVNFKRKDSSSLRSLGMTRLSFRPKGRNLSVCYVFRCTNKELGTQNLKTGGFFMADTPRLVSSMGRAELERIFVRNYDLNKICSARLPSRRCFISCSKDNCRAPSKAG